MPILTDIVDSRILKIEISRPEKRNSLNAEMITELTTAFAQAEKDKAIRVVLLHAQQGIFSAGSDLEESLKAPSDEAAKALTDAVSRCSKPVIACVQGPAVGLAVTLLYCSDLVYCSDNALFSLPYTALGLTPRYGVSLLVAQNAGIRKAMQKILLSEPISANEAFAMNLVNGVFAENLTYDRTLATAKRLAQLSPVAVAESKAVLKQIFADKLQQAARLEETAFERAARTDYAKEAHAAFLEGRSPDFSDK